MWIWRRNSLYMTWIIARTFHFPVLRSSTNYTWWRVKCYMSWSANGGEWNDGGEWNAQSRLKRYRMVKLGSFSDRCIPLPSGVSESWKMAVDMVWYLWQWTWLSTLHCLVPGTVYPGTLDSSTRLGHWIRTNCLLWDRTLGWDTFLFQ